MRWDDLFADLEAQLTAADDAAWEADVVDQARAERMSVKLTDRLRAHAGPLRVHLADGVVLRAVVAECGQDWLLLDGARAGAPAQEVLVPLAGLTHVEGLGSAALPADGPVSRRLSLNVVLRGLVRARSTVEIHCQGGPGPLTGTLDAAGADHVDLAAHPADLPRRPANVTALHAVRTAAIVRIRAS